MKPRLLKLRFFEDARGVLAVAEREDALPFAAVRYFVVSSVPAGATRAAHAQRVGHELLSCVAGSCTVELSWSGGEATHRLEDPGTALYVPPLVWVRCRDFSADATLLVLCSHPYDPRDQITDLDEFAGGALERPAVPGS
jgi:dTDP-4-dehydrorhamnose 3,5-epimerase-like enzyme